MCGHKTSPSQLSGQILEVRMLLLLDWYSRYIGRNWGPDGDKGHQDFPKVLSFLATIYCQALWCKLIFSLNSSPESALVIIIRKEQITRTICPPEWHGLILLYSYIQFVLAQKLFGGCDSIISGRMIWSGLHRNNHSCHALQPLLSVECFHCLVWWGVNYKCAN